MDCKIKLVKEGDCISVDIEGQGYDLIFTLVTVMNNKPELQRLFSKSAEISKIMPEGVDVEEAISAINKMDKYINNLLNNTDGTIN